VTKKVVDAAFFITPLQERLVSVAGRRMNLLFFLLFFDFYEYPFAESLT
jgi:hypothetical protein